MSDLQKEYLLFNKLLKVIKKHGYTDALDKFCNNDNVLNHILKIEDRKLVTEDFMKFRLSVSNENFIMNDGATIHDPVFGQMTFYLGWRKKIDYEFGGKRYSINCIAKSFNEKPITTVQQKSYRQFTNDKKINEKVMAALVDYFLKGEKNKNKFNHMVKQLTPTDLVFKQDGDYGILFNSEDEPEHGIVVCLSPKIMVGEQDIFL